MKITKRHLKQIIREAIAEDPSNKIDDINITMDVPEREGVTLSVKAFGKKVRAFLESDEGQKQIGDNEEDKRILLGILKAVLETTTKKTKKRYLVKLIARLTGESESEKDTPSLMSKILNDRTLSSYAMHIKDKKTRLV